MDKADAEKIRKETIQECADVIMQRAGRDWRAGTAMFQECVNHANAILALQDTLPADAVEISRPRKKLSVSTKRTIRSNWPSAR